MSWSDVVRLSFAAALLVATVYLTFLYRAINEQTNRQRRNEWQQLKDGFLIGYSQCVEDQRTAVAAGEVGTRPRPAWTEEQVFERIAAQYFRNQYVVATDSWWRR